jgi:CRISPR-associated protein Csm2
MSNGKYSGPGSGTYKGAPPSTPRTDSVQISFWKNKETKLVDPKLFSEKAEKLATDIKREHEESKTKRNKPSQLRKFYDEVVRLDELARKHGKEGEKWDRLILPALHMLIAKTAYAEGRELVSSGFKNFIRQSVGQVESPEDLAVFAGLFEAFIGFYKGLGVRG